MKNKIIIILLCCIIGLMLFAGAANAETIWSGNNFSSWTKTSCSINATNAVSDVAAAGVHNLQYTYSMGTGTNCTIQVNASAMNGQYLALGRGGTADTYTSRYAIYNLSNGTVARAPTGAASASIMSMGGGVYMCTFSFTSNGDTSIIIGCAYDYNGAAANEVSVTGAGNARFVLLNATYITGDPHIPAFTPFTPVIVNLALERDPVTLPTYDGSGQSIHPSLIYNPARWNGYLFQLAYTPYPGVNVDYENPSTRYSNDLRNWTTIPGQHDPIIPRPANESFINSDPNIVLKDGTQYLFYRVYSEDLTTEYVNYTTTTDGITYTPNVTLSNIVHPESPSFMWNEEYNEWECWASRISDRSIRFYNGSTLETMTEYASINFTTPDNYVASHLEVKKHDGLYYMFYVGVKQATGVLRLYIFESNDRFNWICPAGAATLSESALTPWAVTTLYKASFEYIGDRWAGLVSGRNGTVGRLGIASEPVKPYVNFTANNTTGDLPLAVQFNDSSISTGNTTSWQWSFGDGTANSTEKNPAHVYTEAGTYTVMLNVTDSYGVNISARTGYIVLTDDTLQPPEIIDLTATPTSITAGQSVAFTSSISTESCMYAWNFGDGTANATTANATHTYNTAGTYTVILTVTNEAGSDSMVKTNMITVSVAPEPTSDWTIVTPDGITIILGLVIIALVALIGFVIIKVIQGIDDVPLIPISILAIGIIIAIMIGLKIIGGITQT